MLLSVASKLLSFAALATSHFALPIIAQADNHPADHVMVINLYQKHVKVSGDLVAAEFIRNIMANGVGEIQGSFPDKVIGTINGPTGPPTQRVDLTVALTDVFITSAREKKRSSGKRKQEDWMTGFATFSVRKKGHGIPEADSSHPSRVKTYLTVHARFKDVFYGIAGGNSPPLVCVPCEMVAGFPCNAGGGVQPCTPQGVPVLA